jgi:hypothetical protein
MADAALFVGWGNPVHGREAKSLDVFGESLTYWLGLQEAGKVESVNTYLLEPHGGELNGFAVLNGDAEALDEVRRSDEWQRLVVKAGLIVENLGVVAAVTGEALTAQMGVYGEEAAAVS